MDPDATGAGIEGEVDGFHQPTAMFDKGQFLGELADLQDGGPDTRAAVDTVEPPRGCRLIIVAGPDIGLEWAFKVPEIIIGRDEDCQLSLNDIAVSRKHAKLTLEGQRFFLSDLGSGNGTHLNGARVDVRVELSPGDEIVIGERTLRFVELNESPPTAAAHPISPGGREPLVGDPGSIDDEDSFRPLGGRSQIKVDALGNEPVPGTKQVPKNAPVAPPQGAALKKTLIVFIAAAGLLATLIAGWLVWEKTREEETEAQRMARSKKEFLQGIELAKAKRCGDALLLFNRVLLVRPDFGRARDYAAYCEKELGVWKQLEEARKLGDIGRYTMALEMLDSIGGDTQYVEDIQRLKERYHTAVARRLVNEARALFEQKEYERALDLVARALERSPGLVEARELLDLIEATAKKPQPRKRDKSAVPPVLLRAVAFYKNGQIGPAIDAAEAAGGGEAAVYIERMKRVKALLEETREAHRQKAGGEILRLAPEALNVDKDIAQGEGKVRERLNNLYADGLYLKGVSAMAEGDYVEAYRLLKAATKQKPGHKLAENRLYDLNRKAEEIYYQAYVLKDTNKVEARKIFKRLTDMTPPSNQYHQKAQEWLRANSG
jgi:tetratricopeptide (TPR) repeat protein